MNDKQYVPTFTFTWHASGQIAPEPYRVTCKSVMEALLWFHLERQLKEKLESTAYGVDLVQSDQTPPQSWAGDELPRRATLQWCLLTPQMAKAYHAEVSEARDRGLHLNVA